MKKAEFQEWVKDRVVYLDGATGSNLLKRGMPGGVCPEQWILEHPDVLTGLQKEYVEAGTELLYAPTFSGNRIKLREYGLEAQAGRMNRELAALSKQAAGGRALVAGDLTMTGEQLAPIGRMDLEELIGIYKEQIGYLLEAEVDLLVVETMMSLQECRAALIAAKELCDLPVLVSMTFEADGRSLYGTDAVTAALTLQSLGASAVGANCSTGPEQMAELIGRMARYADIPILAKPNAGMPSLDAEGHTVYDKDARAFGREMALLLEQGASLLGGCCGTTPEHIAALVRETKGKRPGRRGAEDAGRPRFLTSERRTLTFGLSDRFLVVGERINPTGKKTLQAQLREGSMELVRTLAEEQEAQGADILDVNMGMSGVDEKALMLQAIEEVTQIAPLPLSLDSSHVDVMAAALRRYPGRALINSVSCESAKMEPLLQLAAKYGAMLIVLPLSDAGLPGSLDEKKQNIRKVLDRALEIGLRREDIIVDGLVATVGASRTAAAEALETIRYCRELGLATICGLSNISFGLPQRSTINTAFLTMAIQAGLTMAIANPGQELLQNAAAASDLLLGKEGADVRYIERMNRLTAQARQSAQTPGTAGTEGGAPRGSGMAQIPGTAGAEGGAPRGSGMAQTPGNAGAEGGAPQGSGMAQTQGTIDRLREAVRKGNRKQIAAWTEQAVSDGFLPKDILDQALLPAIGEVGDLYEQGVYFLPQLIASAEAMKRAIEYLEPLLAQDPKREKLPAIVIATVRGDIHDIGKNLVALMLKNYGFEVIDLGKDVPREEIVEAARAHEAKIICLSALMTTTMQEMKRVIDYKNEQGVDALVMIGGAVITQDYADEIGADGYSGDAAEAVRVARRLLGL